MAEVKLSLTLASAFTAVCFATYYQLVFKDLIYNAGVVGRPPFQPLNNEHCSIVPELQACEKLILHEPSGLVYLACSNLESRIQWLPAMGHLNASGISYTDHVAVYDPSSSKVKHLKVSGYPSPVPLQLHGMDVVTDHADSSQLWVYLVNHPPFSDPNIVGADSRIEVFTTKVGGDELVWRRTVHEPAVIITPNDVVGSPDGKSFYFTNDAGHKGGKLQKSINLAMGIKDQSVGFCKMDEGCKFAATKLKGTNGIAKGPEPDVYYVPSNTFGMVHIMERQGDDTLTVTNEVKTGMFMDNVWVDKAGSGFIAAFPKFLELNDVVSDPEAKTAQSEILRLTLNTDTSSFYGEKYKIEKIFEDSGSVASGITTAAWDSKRKQLYLTGVVSPHVTVCKINKGL